MNTAERIHALRSLHQQLKPLITTDESAMFPALQHLDDLIRDLEIQEERGG